tara:strand:+ start:40 stop:606 length:567 start_codon:yes stop_codon:yes gene_type:complete
MLQKKSHILLPILFFVVFISINSKGWSETMLKDNFKNPNLWRYIADDVMGGVSQGQVDFETINGSNVAILRGNVSTENNGGFIQIRRDLKNINLNEAQYVNIIARGNNQKYFIFLRTTGTILPWQYYSSEFEVTDEFEEFILPIDEFKKSGVLMIGKVNPKNITSIGIVAFGRDHQAELYVRKIEFKR